ncbi:MAG TPA: DinB family protein [Tepidisphaeraceae bacterium]|jgi:hypothetical protein
MDRTILEHFEAGGAKLRQAISNLTKEDLLTKPPGDWDVGKWSIQYVVMHLADSDGVLVDRMKRIIAEENPTLMAFDETKWAEKLDYDTQSAADAVELIDINRRQMGVVLKNLPEAAFSRSGTHSQAGKKTLEDVVRMAVNHLDHHLKFIHAKRAKMGKEMW